MAWMDPGIVVESGKLRALPDSSGPNASDRQGLFACSGLDWVSLLKAFLVVKATGLGG